MFLIASPRPPPEPDLHLAPSIRQPRTRADYWRAWRLVVTWGVARKALGTVLPMSLTTLKALTWDLVCSAEPTSQVELVWCRSATGGSIFRLQ
jgi:hypothetical protein